MIPVFDAAAEYESHADELREAAERVLASGRYIMGAEVEAFEQEVGHYLGTPHAVSCASGTDALWLSLRALDIGPGDFVIAPSFTFFATASAILTAGAVPVLCDVLEDTLTLDPEAVRSVLEGRSDVHRRIGIDPRRIKAIVPVHLYGQPADMDEIGDLGLQIVEDAAQSFGALYGESQSGTIGEAGAYSFFPTKNLGGFGDGGLVTTRDDHMAERLRMLRAHGSKPKYVHRIVGTNSRLDALQAAMLRVRLRHLDEALKGRLEVADGYDEVLFGAGVGVPHRAPGRTHSFNLYVVRIPEGRDAVAKELRERGIGTAVHYPSPVHLQEAVADLGYRPGDLPVSERACSEVLSLPTYPTLGAERAREIAKAVSEVAGGRP